LVDYLRLRAADHGPSDLSSAAPRPIFLDVRGRPFDTVAVRLLAVLVAALALAGAAAAQTRVDPVLQKRLARALVVPHVRPSQTGALAVDLGTGETVYAQNAAVPFAPASNEKLPVTLTALAVLGPAFRFETDVLGEGSQEGTVWHGSLVLQGHGDPTLSSGDLERLALQLRGLGLRRVTGGIVGDESWFDSRRTAPGWKPSFYVNESPPLSALAVDRAHYHGAVSAQPALGAALAFRDALRAAGIAVAGRPTTDRADAEAFPLVSVISPTLATIVRTMDLESDNFTAELLLKELGAMEADRGTTAAGAAVVTKELAAADVPLAGVRIVDGSGLSSLDRLTPNALVGILEAAWSTPQVRTRFVAALPVAGVSGTLHDRMRRAPARGNVVAKTGTTSIASALSGFVRGRYVFAVVHNGHPVSSWWARVAQDRFATVLAGQ
jgi:serine-type D-Ala-D-Ala carboxypeptidase/endopeptidase (penicillin-binding protein 4)